MTDVLITAGFVAATAGGLLLRKWAAHRRFRRELERYASDD